MTYQCKSILFVMVSWLLAFSVFANEQAELKTEQAYIAKEQQQIQQLQSNKLRANADFWREVRAGTVGFTPSANPEGGRLINAAGEKERIIHNKYMVPLVGLSLVGVFGIFLLFYLVNGPAKLAHGFSGKMLERWSLSDRWFHWAMAVPCLVLMLTGLVITLGRHILQPILSEGIWAGLIFYSKTLHDWSGPLFVIFWLLSVIKWMPKQTFKHYDLKWFLTAGGYVNFGRFKGQHPDSGFANAGEKMWFWTLTIVGLIISVTGFMLVLPELNLARNISIIALLLHAASAAILIAFTVVHIWMATALSEGGLESMVSGYCDENWAIQHHNIWYQELKSSNKLHYKDSGMPAKMR